MTPRVERTTISLMLAGAVIIIAVAASLGSYGCDAVWEFALGAGGTWTWLVVTFARLRRQHSSAGEDSGAGISPATWVTIARGLLIALVAGHVFVAHRGGRQLWVAAVLYSIAALADRADGAIARRSARVTELGARLDVVTDALGLLVAPLLGVRAGRLPPWYLALALAYPAFRLALRLRRACGAPIFAERLRPDPRARFFAGAQMAVVGCALYPVLPVAVTWTAATIAMVPTLALFLGEWRLATRSAPDGGARAERLYA
jgi:CDP-diacylglycerol---glycerol-3-phosphate 3-phosphatidyltransferase